MMLFFAAIQPYLVFIVPLFIINIVTHWAYARDSSFANLQRISPPRQDNHMVYLVAGNLNQPFTAFGFMLSEAMQSGVTAVNYPPSGFQPDRIAHQILSDIDDHRYEAVIYTISVGDQVGYYIRQSSQGRDIPVITINPCTSPDFLKTPFRILMKIFTPILVAIGWLLGWISELEWIPACRHRYSLALLFAQWYHIAYGPTLSTLDEPPLGIIYSRRDQFLDNDHIEAAFPHVISEYIDTSHANTVGDGARYLTGLRALYRYLDHDIWHYARPIYIRDDEYARN